MATRKKDVQQESAINDSRRVYTRALFPLLRFLFSFENFYPRTRINQPGGKLLQWLVNSENSHDTPRWCTMARYSENTTLTWNILMTLDNSVSQPEARPIDLVIACTCNLKAAQTTRFNGFQWWSGDIATQWISCYQIDRGTRKYD